MLEGTNLNLSATGGVWFVAFIALHLTIAVMAAHAVYTDAKGRKDLVFRLPPMWWAIVILLSSLAGVLAYWVMHHSTLSRTSVE